MVSFLFRAFILLLFGQSLKVVDIVKLQDAGTKMGITNRKVVLVGRDMG
jgi:hypothetical protein